MSLFLLKVPDEVQVSGPRSMLIEAVAEGDAIFLANNRFDSDFDWGNGVATVTELLEGSVTDLEGYRYVVRISAVPPAVDDDLTIPTQADIVAEATGEASDSIDDIGDKLVTALLAVRVDGDLVIAGAAYDADTNTLTVAETTDGLGDRNVRVDVFLPGAKYGLTSQSSGQFVDSVTAGGAEAAALTVVFTGTAVEPTYEDWVFTVRVSTLAAVTVTAGAGDDINDVAADLVTGLNALAIDGASWSASTRVLTVAAIADALGDQTVEIDVYNGTDRADQSAGLVEDITDGGISGAALTITFAAPSASASIPKIYDL